MSRQEEAFRRMDQYVQQRRREVRNPGMIIAVTDREETMHLATYGVTDLGTGTPVTPDTLFEIGSVSKTFGAVVALQAGEAELLDLHTPVAEYLPWFEVQSKYAPITLHHLLSHSAGLVHSMDFSPDPRGVVWGLRNTEVGFAPGEHFYYSEVGYQILTLVLEKVHGRPYAEIVQAGVFDPLDMTDSVSAITHAVRPRLAQGYQHLYDDRPPHVSHPLVPAAWMEFNSSDGCITSTAVDMAKFVRMLLNRGRGPSGPILSETSFERMIREVVEGSEHGYGIRVLEDDGCLHIGHGGDMPGYEAYMFMDLDSGLGEVLLSVQPYPMEVWWRVLDVLRAGCLDKPWPELPPPADPTRVENAEDYAGTYRAEGESLIFTAEGDRLWLESLSLPSLKEARVPLEPRDEDCFYVNHPGFDLYLLRFGRVEGEDKTPGPVVEVAYGPDWYSNDLYIGPKAFPYPPEWDVYVGHYRMHNPWMSNFRVIVRKGRLLFVRPTGEEFPPGEEALLVPLGDRLFRIGEEAHSPERLQFDQIVDGQALCARMSGCDYYRWFTP